MLHCYRDHCSICLDAVDMDTDAFLICGHQHHIQCIQGLMMCPVCRGPVVLLYPCMQHYKAEVNSLKTLLREKCKKEDQLYGVITARNTTINQLKSDNQYEIDNLMNVLKEKSETEAELRDIITQCNTKIHKLKRDNHKLWVDKRLRRK